MAARVLSTTASEMQGVAVAWQVYGLTHRALDLGLVGLAQFLPGILLFLIAGHAADRYPRRRILQICYAGFSLCSFLLLALTMAHVSSVTWVYGVLLLNGVVRAFNGPASQSFLPLLIPAEDFPNAVAWGSSIFQASMAIGPMVGGLVYGITGDPLAVYASAAVEALGSLILISGVRIEAVPRVHRAATLDMLLDGFRYIWRHPRILGAISLDLFAVLLGGAVALMPIFAEQILHVGALGLGVLRGAPSAGAVLMAIVLAYFPMRRRAGAAMLWCVFGFGVFTIVFGLSRSVLLSIVVLMLVGACDMVSVIVRHTLVQLGTPDEMRGRVSAVNGVFIGASNEVGQFESGLTAQWFGAVPAVILGGFGTILVVVLWMRWFPELYHTDNL